MAASRVFRWLTDQYHAYMALPAPVRALIERCLHFLGLFILGVAGGLAAGLTWQQASMVALAPAGGGQYSLHRQLPRDPDHYHTRANQRLVDEDTIP